MDKTHKYKIFIDEEFDNTKDIRDHLGISRSTFKKLLSVNLVKKMYE